MNFTCWPYKKYIYLYVYIYINILALHKKNILCPLLIVGALHMLIIRWLSLQLLDSRQVPGHTRSNCPTRWWTEPSQLGPEKPSSKQGPNYLAVKWWKLDKNPAKATGFFCHQQTATSKIICFLRRICWVISSIFDSYVFSYLYYKTLKYFIFWYLIVILYHWILRSVK